MKISAVIPIRKGSQRVKDKNLRPFDNTTLLDFKIMTLLKVPELDEIIVNTDSEEAIQKVIDYDNPKLKYYRRDNSIDGCSGGLRFFEFLAKTTKTDVFVYTPVTTPFIKAKTISECINMYLSENQCIATGAVIKRFMWKDGVTHNYDYNNPPASQDLPEIIIPTFGCCVIDKKELDEVNNVIGKTPRFVITDEIESLDIDTPLDFYIASQLYHKMIVEGKDLLD